MIETALITIGIIGSIGTAVAVTAMTVVTVGDLIAMPAREVRSERTDPDLSGHVTVDEVIVRLGLEPHRDLTWAVGRQMRDLYMERRGEPPPAERRRKTSGKGSHSKSVYPAEMISDLEALIRAATVKEAA